MKTRKEKLKGRLRAWVSAGSSSENYGFGSNWNLNIGTKNKLLKQFLLGQGAKVTARALGIDYGDYTKLTRERIGRKTQFRDEADWLSNKKINKIVTEDVLHSAFGDVYAQNELSGGWQDKINSKRLKKLLKAQDWDLAVQ